MNLFRTSDDLDTLRHDLRAVQRDLHALTRNIGALTGEAWHARRAAGDWAGNWLQRQAGVDLSSERGREQAMEQLREQGQRSAAAVRDTVREHPMKAALGALAIGFAVVWMMTRSSGAK
jgi:ElaB/YqjD/DUF883 family membrane-anchored ribosome-binding protein